MTIYYNDATDKNPLVVLGGNKATIKGEFEKEDRMMPKIVPPLELSAEEPEELQQLVNRHSTPQQIALRANIILLAAAGENHRALGRRLNISRDMARLWRNRWIELKSKNIAVGERLVDAPRPGGPMSFRREQSLQLFAIACHSPEAHGRPISHWTARDLADEVIQQGIFETISPRHVGRLLSEADLKPHQSQYWLNPPRPSVR